MLAAVDQVGLKQVTKMVPKMVPIMVPKATDTSDTSETFKGISGDIAPNGYKGFGANPRQ